MVPDWGKARFASERLQVERLLQSNQLAKALHQGEELLAKAEKAGPQAYPDADYDLAGAKFLFGRVLERAGDSSAALPHLEAAQKIFESLETGAKMASVAIKGEADCLRSLGELNKSAALYEEATRRDKERGDKRVTAPFLPTSDKIRPR